MNTFHIRIAELDNIVYEGDAVHCRVRTEVGALGLEARHEPFLAALELDSSIEIRDAEGETKQFPAASGMLSFNNNRCLILIG